MTNEDVATFVVSFESGAVGTFSLSRVAIGYPNALQFQLFGTQAGAAFDWHRPAEFAFVDTVPHAVTNGWRQVLVGPEHPYVAAGQAMPFAGVGHGNQDLFTYQARSFLDEIAGLDRLPRCASFADGLHNLRVEEAVVEVRSDG